MVTPAPTYLGGDLAGVHQEGELLADDGLQHHDHLREHALGQVAEEHVVLHGVVDDEEPDLLPQARVELVQEGWRALDWLPCDGCGYTGSTHGAAVQQ